MDDSGSVHVDALIRAPSGVYRSLVLSGADREISFTLVDAGTGVWTEAQKDTMRAVFDAWEAVADLRFAEVAANAAPEWREQMFGPEDIKTASHSLPWALEMQGSYKFGPEVPAGPGSQMMALFLHETAHGLGLGHSRDGFPGVTRDNSGGDHGLRDAMFTQMAGVAAGEALTITGGAFGGETDGGRVYGNPATPMAFDIAAVQFLYGADTSGWELVARYPIHGALPSMRGPLTVAGSGEHGPVILAGDHRATASIQGAMISGRHAADAACRRLGVVRPDDRRIAV
jgi:hypothetical protein